MIISQEKALKFYKKMSLIRKMELKVIHLASEGKVFGNLHMYIGQEAVAVGAISTLYNKDLITSGHRGIAHILAKGGDPRKVLAELMGRTTGYCRGRAGKMHIAAPEIGMMGAHGIVGSGIPLAVGMALDVNLSKKDTVVMSFFGDGAINHGYFHESLNLASLWKLPILFICENNLYAISTHIKDAMASKNLTERAKAYNITTTSVDGMDVFEVYKISTQYSKKIREGKGPFFIEAKTYRFRGHHERDS